MVMSMSMSISRDLFPWDNGIAYIHVYNSPDCILHLLLLILSVGGLAFKYWGLMLQCSLLL